MDQTPNPDATLDAVVKFIYSSCDLENTNSVPVASLIDFVKPYLLDNLSELSALKLQLDPTGINPCVSCEVFSQAMLVWTVKLKERDSSEDSDNPPPISDNENLPAHPSIGYYELSKNRSEVLNLSSVSIYGTSENTVVQDKSQCEEQIKELQHSTQKTTQELDLLKQQLSAAEEQNEQLVLDLNKATKLLKAEQQLTKQLKDEKIDTEELIEEIKSLRSKNMCLENKLRHSDIEQQRLLQESSDVDNKKTQIEYKLETSLQTECELKKTVTELNEIIDFEETEITSLIKVVDTLKCDVEEREELLTFYTKENERLKNRTFDLEKYLEEKYSDFTFNNSNLEKSTSADTISTNAGDGVKPRTRNEVPLRRMVLTRPTNTPNEHGEILQESLKTEIESCPIAGDQSNKAESANSPPIMNVVDTADSSRRSTSYQKSLKDEFSDASVVKCLQDEISRLNVELPEQEEINNILWRNARQAEKDAESLKRYKEDFEKLVNDLEEKRQRVRLLQQNLNVSTFSLEEEKRLNSELKRQLEIEIIKNQAKNKQTDEFLEKTFDHKFSQTDDKNLQTLLKEIDLLNSKCMELENFTKFLSETKDSLEKLWLDNQIATQEAENIVSSIYGKVETELVSKNFIAFNKKGSELLNQLPVLERMIDTLLLNVNKNNTAASSLDKELPKTNYGKQQLRIERMKDKIEKLEREISFERNLRIQMNDENVRNRNDIPKLNYALQQYKDINEKRLSEIKKLKQKALDYEEDLEVLRNEKEHLNEEIQNLLNEQQRLKAELRQATSDELEAKNELTILKQTNNMDLLRFQKSLEEKEEQFSVFENVITSFISIGLKEFQKAISNISGKLKGNLQTAAEHSTHLDLQKELSTNLEENLHELNSNMQFALFLLKTVTDNYLDLIDNENIARQSGKDESLDGESLVSPSGGDASFDFVNSSLNSDESSCSLEIQNVDVRRKFVQRVLFGFVTFIFVLIVLLVIGFLYTEWKCSQSGRTQVCYFEWISEFLIGRVLERPTY